MKRPLLDNEWAIEVGCEVFVDKKHSDEDDISEYRRFFPS